MLNFGILTVQRQKVYSVTVICPPPINFHLLHLCPLMFLFSFLPSYPSYPESFPLLHLHLQVPTLSFGHIRLSFYLFGTPIITKARAGRLALGISSKHV